MKRIIALVLVVMLALVMLAACDSTDTASTDQGGTGTDSNQTNNTGNNSTNDTASNNSNSQNQDTGSTADNSGTQDTNDAPTSNFDNTRYVSVVTREEGSGTRDAMRDLFDIRDADGRENVTLEAIVADGTGVMITNVANDPYAIGYCSLASLNDTVRALDIDGVEPTVENVKNGSYAIQRPFYLATMGDADGLAADFIHFILSSEGQEATTRRCIPAIDNAPAYSGSRPSGKIVVGGSSSVSPVMEDLIAAYAIINPNAEIELQVSDSTNGMNDAKSGVYDIGMASREVREAEVADGLVPIFIAIDGIAVIVNSSNPLTALSREQVRSIYNGETERWSET